MDCQSFSAVELKKLMERNTTIVIKIAATTNEKKVDLPLKARNTQYKPDKALNTCTIICEMVPQVSAEKRLSQPIA